VYKLPKDEKNLIGKNSSNLVTLVRTLLTATSKDFLMQAG
jgi:hypothetical protein